MSSCFLLSLYSREHIGDNRSLIDLTYTLIQFFVALLFVLYYLTNDDFFLHFSAPLEIQRNFWFEKNQFYVIALTSALEKGQQYKIKMKFRAELGDGLAGLYKSTYTRKDGTEVYVNFINPSTFFLKLLTGITLSQNT